MTSNPMKFGVHYQPFTKRIEAGRLNKAQTEFLDKHDVTSQVLGAIALMTKAIGDEGATYTIAGMKIHVEVEESETHDDQ